MISGNENAPCTARHCVYLSLESPSRVGVLCPTFLGNAVGINVVAEEEHDRAFGRDGHLRVQRIQHEASLARIWFAGVADQKQRRLDVSRRQLLRLYVEFATSGSRECQRACRAGEWANVVHEAPIQVEPTSPRCQNRSSLALFV